MDDEVLGDDDIIIEVTQDWIDGMMHERKAIAGMVRHAIEHANIEEWGGPTSLALLLVAIELRTEVVEY